MLLLSEAKRRLSLFGNLRKLSGDRDKFIILGEDVLGGLVDSAVLSDILIKVSI